MRKIYILITTLFLVILTACNNSSIERKIINKIIPNKINTNLKLPSVYDDYELAYYLNDELIEDDFLILPYLYNDEEAEIIVEFTKGSKSTRKTKTIILGKSKFVNDIYIYVDEEIQHREYIDGSLLVNPIQGVDEEPLKLEIRGRGNSTWSYEKKPYRIKFNSRQSLLGMKSAKNYVLLADYGDKSLLRNYFAHTMSKYTNLDYTLDVRHVRLFLNGEYNGVYLLTEQVEIDKNRLDIPSDVGENGFLLELEDFGRLEDSDREGIEYIIVNKRAFLIKGPKLEKLSLEEALEKSNFAKSYLQEVMNSLANENYTEWIDEEQFIEYFMIQELVKNVDINFSSVFMHRRPGERLKMGPLWDFDITMGNGDYYPYQPSGYWASNNVFLEKLLENPLFKENYINRFKAFLLDNKDDIENELSEAYNYLYPYAEENFLRWNTLGRYDWPNPPEMVAANTYYQQYKYLLKWYQERVEWLLANLDKL